MSDECCRVPEAGQEVCDLPAPGLPRPAYAQVRCRISGAVGKPVQGQTIKSLLAVSLRAVQDVEYRFCPTPGCPVVYFTGANEQTFTLEQVREPVYQKLPDDPGVKVCYCFGYTLGDIRDGTAEQQQAILADIEAGIQAGQCACDLRNPQGSCCLGNVRRIVREATARAA